MPHKLDHCLQIFKFAPYFPFKSSLWEIYMVLVVIPASELSNCILPIFLSFILSPLSFLPISTRLLAIAVLLVLLKPLILSFQRAFPFCYSLDFDSFVSHGALFFFPLTNFSLFCPFQVLETHQYLVYLKSFTLPLVTEAFTTVNFFSSYSIAMDHSF